MIIFDLDGTLADCEHRRHFIDPRKRECNCGSRLDHICKRCMHWQPDYKSFYEACDQDGIITPVKSVLIQYCHREIEIWSGRCESVRKKTELWLGKNIFDEDFKRFLKIKLKMRPIGDNTPDEILKERWLDEALAEGKKIDMVFDDRVKVVDMYRKRGIFVFDCNQTRKVF